jgi:hypothetical protein
MVSQRVLKMAWKMDNWKVDVMVEKLDVIMVAKRVVG